jgi:Zn-dependent metalloprotease
MLLRDSQLSPLTKTYVVRFEQAKSSVPILGSSAVVELDRDKKLLAVDASLATVSERSVEPSLKAEEALQNIAVFTGALAENLRDVALPDLAFYHEDEADKWHLVYHCHDVPAAPRHFFDAGKRSGPGSSPACLKPSFDYLVDANDGTIRLFWSSVAYISAPTRCKGHDEEGILRSFLGQSAGEEFLMRDPIQNVETYDYGFRDIEAGHKPVGLVRSRTATFSDMRCFVSAHWHATIVDDFFRSVLKRDGYDDRGSALISHVNCVVSSGSESSEWPNAAWWRQKMWYGQVKDQSGNLRSFSRYLERIPVMLHNRHERRS